MIISKLEKEIALLTRILQVKKEAEKVERAKRQGYIDLMRELMGEIEVAN